ncbi:hypothetical protein PUNSTDRAFT_134901 [Punctularia strigosozonata HHB-11173 SS5]|uniref:uncharacterized protein n=1 Tax=Punctularia strigosozonata (strain HHB-11173) TaxID=741275 RepID=UPI0004417F1B|nr:uncharacterized protein PUNSTDRAFT_134901 [Punctularia strigosozonata HHB-11173 SS5]EIN08522.1 hypothetical protein PUNSTDRAFT_134901 [Punctularia strigosozonata HHB-11173 SS5]
MALDIEDILNDSLEFLDPGSAGFHQDDGTIQYGPIKLTVAPKEGKANTLLADHLFSPSLLLAERVERGLIPVAGKSVIELGAGCALPSILLSTLPEPQAPSLVIPTDYPDPVILNNLQGNVERNANLATPRCTVKWQGHAWGEDTDKLTTAAESGYDIVILSDLLHFDSCHHILLKSLLALLAKRPASRIYCAAGRYTPPHVCDAWLDLSRASGIEWKEETEDPESAEWRGKMPVLWGGRLMDQEALATRKGMCRLWIGKWKEGAIA